jgi:hypothetical protein
MATLSFLPKSKNGPGEVLLRSFRTRDILTNHRLVDVIINNTQKEWEEAKGLEISLKLERSNNNGFTWQFFVGFTAVGGPLAKDEKGTSLLPAVRNLLIPPDTTHIRGSLSLNQPFNIGVNLISK